MPGTEILGIVAFGNLVHSILSRWDQISRQRKKAVLDDVVKPLYDGLEAVHRDYVAFFQKARQGLEAGEDPRGVIEALRRERRVQAPLRERIYTETDELSRRKKYEEVDWFLMAIEEYFAATPLFGDNPAPTPSTILIEELEERLRRLETDPADPRKTRRQRTS